MQYFKILPSGSFHSVIVREMYANVTLTSDTALFTIQSGQTDLLYPDVNILPSIGYSFCRGDKVTKEVLWKAYVKKFPKLRIIFWAQLMCYNLTVPVATLKKLMSDGNVLIPGFVLPETGSVTFYQHDDRSNFTFDPSWGGVPPLTDYAVRAFGSGNDNDSASKAG